MHYVICVVTSICRNVFPAGKYIRNITPYVSRYYVLHLKSFISLHSNSIFLVRFYSFFGNSAGASKANSKRITPAYKLSCAASLIAAR